MYRYKGTKKGGTKKYNNRNVSNYYETTIYNSIDKNDNDMYFIAQDGDRCDNLAYRFYGNPSFWWYIARINNLNTMNIPAGKNLRIPISIKRNSTNL